MPQKMTKEKWVDLFREVGLDDAQMKQWHHLFEARHPEEHQSFLEWLGLSAADCARIRQMSR